MPVEEEKVEEVSEELKESNDLGGEAANVVTPVEAHVVDGETAEEN